MTVKVTSYRVTGKVTESGECKEYDVPFLICNITFKIDGGGDNGFYKQRAINESKEIVKDLIFDSPEDFEIYLLNNGPPKTAWRIYEPEWKYLEKFDTFWFRNYVADCTVTRQVLKEIEYFMELGKFPSSYRNMDTGVFLRHLRCLGLYWD